MILTRTFTSDLHGRDDDRVISGTLVPYGQPVQVREYGKTYTEDFAPGAFPRSPATWCVRGRTRPAAAARPPPPAVTRLSTGALP